MMLEEGVAYLNNAAVAPNPISVYEALIKGRKGQAQKGLEGINVVQIGMIWDKIINNFAKFINASPQGVALTNSTTASLILAADGLHEVFDKGGNIVISEIEFVSNSFVWQKVCERYGLTLKTVPFVDGHFQGWEETIDKDTKLVSLSYVQFSNGYAEDIEYISKLAHENDVLFSVDGVQALGVMDFDNSKVNADFLSAGAQKWMLGPLGMGYFYINPTLFDIFKPITVGQHSDKIHARMAHHQLDAREGARRYQIALSPDMVALNESLNTIMRWEPKNIRKHSIELQDHLLENLNDRDNFKIATTLDPNRRSAILRLEYPKAKELSEKLAQENVFVGYYNGGIRVSPHYYNNNEDIDRLLAIMNNFD